MAGDEMLDQEPEDGTSDPGGRTAAGFAAGVLFGALIGASIALLFAPDRGDSTRKRLRRQLRHLREEASEGLDRTTSRARRDLERRRRRLRERVERALERS